MRTRTVLLLTALLTVLPYTRLTAASPNRTTMQEACDSLTARCERHFNVRSSGSGITLRNVTRRGSSYDFYFTNTLSDWPWHTEDQRWFRNELSKELKKVSKSANLGEVYVSFVPFDQLAMPRLGSSGTPSEATRKNGLRFNDPRLSNSSRFIEETGARRFNKGLSDRYIALWQSHGRYFNDDQGYWCWQRAQLHRTVEDMFTQSFVLPYLIPMLENAGAYVMTPRERDIQRLECVCDNDPAFEGVRDPFTRTEGSYSEKGKWSCAGTGFADALPTYRLDENPFTMGTCRQAACTPKGGSEACWTPTISKRGKYAVYVSYKTLPNSTTKARYTVKHLGGSTSFTVNQKRGGGTWIYLGTFEFAEGTGGCVILDNKGAERDFVTADAVRFGGGMGKIAREGITSGYPCYAEGALYNMVWSGVDTTDYVENEWERDYVRDYAMRGAWVKQMKKKKNIPFDMAMAFHSDAGSTPNDSTIGTLAIYTLRCDKKRKYDDGGDRMNGRLVAQIIQDQVVRDLRADFDPEWNRRGLWDRSYSESRTTDIPTMLLELLSHQNFADMKYGLDPSFRFTTCRAVYKGILKYLSELYGCTYAVQPLPVRDFAVQINGNARVRLSWKPTDDPKEPSAKAKGYTVYTRIDDGAFDAGRDVDDNFIDLPVERGHIYSYKVEAWNEGGRSFPSEILAAGIGTSAAAPVLVVNNFDRVSAPAWIDTPDYAGFDARLDSGVPYISDISYIGENYEFRRTLEWTTDDNPGFGATDDSCSGEIVAGNSFDYAYVHGKALMAMGRSFHSMSRDAFISAPAKGDILDLICGKQLTTTIGAGRVADRYEVFSPGLRAAICLWTINGGSVLISGSRIATDAWDRVYPTRFAPDEATKDFCRNVLGYALASSRGCAVGRIDGMPFYNVPNPDCYCVENTDGLEPADANSSIWLRYDRSNIPAALNFDSPNGYRVTSIGVPLECLKNDADRIKLVKMSLEYLDGASKPVNHHKID